MKKITYGEYTDLPFVYWYIKTNQEHCINFPEFFSNIWQWRRFGEMIYLTKTVHREKSLLGKSFQEKRVKICPFLESLLLPFVLRKKAKCGTVDIFFSLSDQCFSVKLSLLAWNCKSGRWKWRGKYSINSKGHISL